MKKLINDPQDVVRESLAGLGSEPAVVTVELDLSALRAFRERFPAHLDADRIADGRHVDEPRHQAIGRDIVDQAHAGPIAAQLAQQQDRRMPPARPPLGRRPLLLFDLFHARPFDQDRPRAISGFGPALTQRT